MNIMDTYKVKSIQVLNLPHQLTTKPNHLMKPNIRSYVTQTGMGYVDTGTSEEYDKGTARESEDMEEVRRESG